MCSTNTQTYIQIYGLTHAQISVVGLRVPRYLWALHGRTQIQIGFQIMGLLGSYLGISAEALQLIAILLFLFLVNLCLLHNPCFLNTMHAILHFINVGSPACAEGEEWIVFPPFIKKFTIWGKESRSILRSFYSLRSPYSSLFRYFSSSFPSTLSLSLCTSFQSNLATVSILSVDSS